MNKIKALAGILGVAALAVILWFATLPPPLVVQGEISTNRVDLSPRVGGRILKLNADVGDTVRQGTIIAELESPQLIAELHMAEAALSVAQADLVRVNSTRPETITARRAELAATEADVILYQEASARQSRLVASGTSSQSIVEEATRNLESAIRKREAAQAALDLAIAGASDEEKQLAASQVEQAKAALDQKQVDIRELTVRAPIDGQVTTRVAELGENFSAGAPLFSIIETGKPWVTFNLREDLLIGLAIGNTFNVSIPALSADELEVRVTMINAQGQYATWRATRATGDFDLRTFEVRAIPVRPVEGWRPGMSVIAQRPPVRER